MNRAEELVVDVELPPMMAEMDVDGVVVVDEDVDPEEEEVEERPAGLLPLMVEGVVAAGAAADDDGLDEFSSNSCWTWRISTYSSRLPLAFERLFIPDP